MELTARDWNKVHAIAKDLAVDVDRNELMKTITFFRLHRDKEKFLALLERLPESDYIRRSRRTRGYFQRIHRTCVRYLADVDDERALKIISWAFRVLTHLPIKEREAKISPVSTLRAIGIDEQGQLVNLDTLIQMLEEGESVQVELMDIAEVIRRRRRNPRLKIDQIKIAREAASLANTLGGVVVIKLTEDSPEQLLARGDLQRLGELNELKSELISNIEAALMMAEKPEETICSPPVKHAIHFSDASLLNQGKGEVLLIAVFPMEELCRVKEQVYIRIGREVAPASPEEIRTWQRTKERQWLIRCWVDIFEIKVARYLEEKMGFDFVRSSYRPPYIKRIGAGEIDVYACDQRGQSRRLLLCECKLRIEEDPDTKPIEIHEVRQLHNNGSKVIEYERQRGRSEGYSIQPAAWLVTNSSKAYPDAFELARRLAVELKTAILPMRWREGGPWAIVDIKSMKAINQE